MVVGDVELTDKNDIVEVWGEGFKPLAGFDIEQEHGPDKPGRKHTKVHFYDDRIVVDLRNPVMLDGEDVMSLVIPEPDVQCMRAMDAAKGSVAKAVLLLSSTAGMTEKVIDKIKGRDFILLGRVIGGFLDDGQ